MTLYQRITLNCLPLVLMPVLTLSCLSPGKPTKQNPDPDAALQKRKNRIAIETHVGELAKSLAQQPVMTPRPGFSGYLAHFQVIRTTTKDSPFAVVVDGEGHTAENTPADLQAFADLKGAHPYGGIYAFSGSYLDSRSKDRNDPDAKLVLEIPGPSGDGMMSIGFSDGEVRTIKAPAGPFDDRRIQSILSADGKPPRDSLK